MSKKYNGKIYLPTIGTFLKEKREHQNINQDIVANEIEITRSTISKYENGELDIPVSKIPEFCEMYKCHMAECGNRVDNEMHFYSVAKDAVKSTFMGEQYMSFSLGTPMVEAAYSVAEELEFRQLIESVVRFREEELVRLELSEKDTERLRQNFSFFMVEFITKNEPDKVRRRRLIELCNHALNPDGTDE